jgi:hypothetical protein
MPIKEIGPLAPGLVATLQACDALLKFSSDQHQKTLTATVNQTTHCLAPSQEKSYWYTTGCC